METIVLTDIEGISRLSGKADAGTPNETVWTQFEVDYFADQEDGICSICGATISAGWMCLDDGSQEVCSEHVTFAE